VLDLVGAGVVSEKVSVKLTIIEVMKGDDYDHFPGWIKCVLIDARGESHIFIEKIPVFCADWNQSPANASLDCMLEGRTLGESNQILCHVSSKKPWGLESIDGRSEFIVTEAQFECALNT
jgi:hypothetical protein